MIDRDLLIYLISFLSPRRKRSISGVDTYDTSNFLAELAEAFIAGQTRSRGKRGREEGRGAAVRENNYAIPAFAYHLYFREHCESRGPL